MSELIEMTCDRCGRKVYAARAWRICRECLGEDWETPPPPPEELAARVAEVRAKKLAAKAASNWVDDEGRGDSGCRKYAVSRVGRIGGLRFRASE